MKKILASLLLVVAFAAIALNAAAPTNFVTTSAYPESYLWADVANKDTLVTVDSTIAISTRVWPQGWNYVLVIPAGWAGTGSDSVYCTVRMDLFAKDTSTTASYTFLVDTIDAITAGVHLGEAISLPINNSLFGYKARVKFIGVTAKTGTQVITPPHYYIYAVRPVTVDRKY